MYDKLQSIAQNYEALQKLMYDPEIGSNVEEMTRINKELSTLQDAYDLFQEVDKRTKQVEEAKEIIEIEDDEEMITYAKQQLSEGEEKLVLMEEKVQLALLPKDPNDNKNIYLEIRPWAWGDESWLFAAELMRMYLRYAETQWRNAEIIENQSTGIGWVKFAMIKVSWDMIYSKLKFESWVHRVQRIPNTESQWRIHTSTVTVAAMPEVDDVEVTIDPSDVEMDTFAASSSWWQHANKNQTWVRLHHKPTGLIVMGTDSKSQLQNKENTWKMLKVRLYQLEMDKQIKEQKDKRFDQIWTGDRSEKIRTYNFPQDRVTDHRIKQSRPNIPAILDGNIWSIVDAVVLENQMKLLEAVG